MINYMKYILAIILYLSALTAVHAQKIQTLPADPAVKSGVLPNGMTYYVASNPSLKGMADFALVQRTGAMTVPGADRDKVVTLSQNALSSQPRLSDLSVQDYFMRTGVVPGSKGFAEVTDNATIFRFENVMLSQAGHVLDSTLLVLMGMAEQASMLEDTVAAGWYSPRDHALIVAGDVDVKQTTEKLKMLSYMVPSSKSLPRKGYVWEEQDSLCLRQSVSSNPDLATVSAVWKLQRTPREYMNTVQPAVYEMFMTELGIVAQNRIREGLEKAGIPCAEVSYDYRNGVESLGDESFRVTLTVSPDDILDGVSILASVLSCLDASDAQISEVRRAELIYMDAVRDRLEENVSNSDYVDRCVSAFMYNSPLTSKKDMLAFYSSRSLADSEGLNMFNSIVSASLDGERNLTLEYAGTEGTVPVDSVRNAFMSSWAAGQENAGNKDSIMVRWPLLQGPGSPVKVKSQKKEPTSGGTMWIMSNGFKVVVKQMPTAAEVHYTLALNGGYANVQDLQSGEGAYISDILKVSRMGGVGSKDFFDAIRQKGMSMDLNVGFSTFALEGTVPEDGLEYMMRVLLTVMNDRETDEDMLDYYIRCELLEEKRMQGSVAARIGTIDNIMCPEYRYSSVKTAGSLTGEFARKADEFMAFQAEKMNDGMLILVGDIDERQLKNVLQTYAGGFRTKDRTFARPVVSYQPISGTVMHTVEGNANSVDMVLSVPMSLTADNYYVAAISTIALRKKLTHAVIGTGMWLRLKSDCRKDPQERFNLMISLNEASVEGFAPGTVCKDPVEALNSVRAALADPQSVDISKEDLASYKAMLKKHVAERKKSPEYWQDAISMRYLGGKDFTTGCDARIDAVTVSKVRELLSSLVNGSRVEYITSKR